MIKQKIMAVLFVLLTVPVLLIEKEATATILALMLAIPMFFSKKDWFY